MTDSTETLRRLDALEATEDIKKLKARYFRFVDEKNHDELGGLFTTDARITTDGVDWPSPGAFVEVIRDLIGQAPTVHHGHMPEIDILGPDTASGIWAMEDLLTFPAAPDAPEGHRGYGQYRETYRKVDGHWLIDSLDLTRFRMDPLKNWNANA